MSSIGPVHSEGAFKHCSNTPIGANSELHERQLFQTPGRELQMWKPPKSRLDTTTGEVDGAKVGQHVPVAVLVPLRHVDEEAWIPL